MRQTESRNFFGLISGMESPATVAHSLDRPGRMIAPSPPLLGDDFPRFRSPRHAGAVHPIPAFRFFRRPSSTRPASTCVSRTAQFLTTRGIRPPPSYYQHVTDAVRRTIADQVGGHLWEQGEARDQRDDGAADIK